MPSERKIEEEMKICLPRPAFFLRDAEDLIITFAKNLATDANHCAAVLYSNFPIVAHSPRTFAEIGVSGKKVILYLTK